MKIKNKSRFPFIGVPILSLLVFAVFYLVGYPFLTYDSWPIQMGSISAIKLIAILAAIVLPLINNKIYRVKLIIPLVFWLLFTFIGLITESGNYEGNQNSGLAGYLLGFQVMATLATAISSTLQRRKSYGKIDP